MIDFRSLAPAQSVIPGIVWPPVPAPLAAQLLYKLNYFTTTERLPKKQLETAQFTQLQELVSFARLTVPYYQALLSHLPSVLSAAQLRAAWLDIPILTRSALQHTSLCSNAVPAAHEPCETITTSGSTGKPISIKVTMATNFFFQVLTLRNHLWFGHQFDKTFAIIDYAGGHPPEGKIVEAWNLATKLITQTGPCYNLIPCTPEQETEWLLRVNPHYLNCGPTTLREIALCLLDSKERPSNLSAAFVHGEIVEPELRSLVKEQLKIKLEATYSAAEVGYIASQCPDHEHYHVHAENVYVEILNDHNEPCQVGEEGRVVITALQNFATPLIRYELGDYAVWGEPCSCGRTLPVIKQVLGRKRNMIQLPDGRRFWPHFNQQGFRLLDLFAGGQYQIVQKSLEEIQINLVGIAPYTQEKEAELQPSLQALFRSPFKFTFKYVDHIPRGPGNKYEDFKSELI